MPQVPLSTALKKFNKDKQPLEKLHFQDIQASVDRKPIKIPRNSDGDTLTVKRDERGGRLPYRMIDAGQKIIEAVKIGSTYRIAAYYAGIHPGTMYNWVVKAEKILARIDADESGDPIIDEMELVYLDFLMRLREAEGVAAVGWLAALNAAAEDGKYQAAEWLLERRFPSEYGKRTEVHQHHTKGASTLEDWQKNAKERRIKATQVVEEFEEIEEADYRVLGKPKPAELAEEN